MICPNPWQCCLFPIQGHPDEAWLISWISMRIRNGGCHEASWKDQYRTRFLLSKLINFSNSVHHLLCKTLYFCNQAWFNWILLGNPCPVTATKEPRFRVRPVLDLAGHGDHCDHWVQLETFSTGPIIQNILKLRWIFPESRFSNFQPLKHEHIPKQYEDASDTLEAQFCSRS